MPARAIPADDRRWVLWLATLLASLAFAADVRHGVYAASVTGGSAYVAAGDLWRTGEIYRPVPLQLRGQATGSLSPRSDSGAR